MFARRQPKVFNISKREFPDGPRRDSSWRESPHYQINCSTQMSFTIKTDQY
jgi:hypothetical protein